MLSFCIFASIRVTRTSKAMQTTAIRTVANSLPQIEVILLTLLISGRYIPYTNLGKNGKVPKPVMGIKKVHFKLKCTRNLAMLHLHRCIQLRHRLELKA